MSRTIAGVICRRSESTNGGIFRASVPPGSGPPPARCRAARPLPAGPAPFSPLVPRGDDPRDGVRVAVQPRQGRSSGPASPSPAPPSHARRTARTRARWRPTSSGSMRQGEIARVERSVDLARAPVGRGEIQQALRARRPGSPRPRPRRPAPRARPPRRPGRGHGRGHAVTGPARVRLVPGFRLRCGSPARVRRLGVRVPARRVRLGSAPAPPRPPRRPRPSARSPDPRHQRDTRRPPAPRAPASARSSASPARVHPAPWPGAARSGAPACADARGPPPAPGRGGRRRPRRRACPSSAPRLRQRVEGVGGLRAGDRGRQAPAPDRAARPRREREIRSATS